MSELYERITGELAPGLPVHQFQALLVAWARGEATAAQARAWVEAQIGEAASAVLVQEIQDLRDSLAGAADPGGATAAVVAARAEAKADRLYRLNRLDRALLLGEQRIVPFDTAANIRAQLNVPTR